MMRLDPDRVRWIFIHTAAYLVGDQYRTHKTGPGERVDMEEIRAALAAPEMPDVPDVLPEPVVEIADTLGVTRWEKMDELDAEL